MKLLQGTLLLKISALAVALLTYFYVRGEIEDMDNAKKVTDPSYKLIKLTAKSLPVKVRLETAPPEGYHILDNQVTVKPSQVIVVGPEALLEEAQTAETAIIDVSENTKTVVKNIPLESVAGIHIGGQLSTFEVTVPIEKIPEPPKPLALPAAEPSAPASQPKTS